MTAALANRTNRLLRLRHRPADGMDALPGDFEVTEEAVRDPGEGQVLVETHVISVDAALRLILQDSEDFLFRVEVGDAIESQAAGRVIASNSPHLKIGDHVYGGLGVQEFAAVDAEGLTTIDLDLAPASAWLGGLGISGLTAYFGLLDVCKPQPGETVLVTGAAGAVGSMVGQIARIKGARVIGTCGSAEKCRWLIDELGFDVALNYKDSDFYEQLCDATPDRINIIFDNVGGDVFDTVIRRLAMHARALICGATSQYANNVMKGPSNYLAFGTWRASMHGFVVFDYAERYADARRDMSQWVKEGKLKFVEDVHDGEIGDFPRVLHEMFQGQNRGKMVLRLPAGR